MPDRPRDFGMSVELREGSGPILTMCSVGDVLEIYKVDRCFEVQSPDSVDPSQIDPNAPWIVRHISTYGAGNEIVARTFLQAAAITDHVLLKDSVKKPAVLIATKGCRGSLLECDRLSNQINNQQNQIIEKYHVLEMQGNVFTSFPTFLGLRELAGAFLLHAKQCLQYASEIFDAFFGTTFHGPHFHKIRDWCKENLSSSGLMDFLTDHEPRAKWVVELRNFFEHPGEKKTEIRDFYWEPDKRSTHVPTWNITGDVPGSISKDSAAIVTFLTDFTEALIILCAIQCTAHFPYIIVQNTPVKPEMPIRYSLEIDRAILSGAKEQ